MDSYFIETLTNMRDDAHKRHYIEVATALSAALKDTLRLRQAMNFLKTIRALPCLDGQLDTVCEKEECPRCLARKALKEIGDQL